MDTSHTEVVISETPPPEVRYTSGLCTYTEKLHNGVWAARSWNPSGHIEFPGVGSTESAFILGNADGPWGGEWQWVSSTELDDDSGSSRHADD